MKAIERIIKQLDLKPHPEGGYFKRSYTSPHLNTEGTPTMTAIYFLITSEDFSAFHRIAQDEMWHFYQGECILLHSISPDGNYRVIKLGNRIENGEHAQVMINAGTWFAAEIISPNKYALTGCTVTPGFTFEGFELAKQDKLVSLCPDQKELIARLTKE